jgi:hypothetical protein
MIHDKKVSPNEAIDILLQQNAEFHRGITIIPWYEEFMFSRYEAVAYLQSATLDELVCLRYEKWPSICCDCSLAIDYESFGWMIKYSPEGKLKLAHINCPNSSDNSNMQ